MDIGLLLLRLAVGLTLAGHGSQKLFGWFAGPGLDGTSPLMEALGFQPGRRYARMAGLVETTGGLLLALGLLTPLGATLAASVMIVGMVTVHLQKGFWLSAGGYEYTLLVAVAALSLAFTGPGALSIDSITGLYFSGVTWGVAAAVVAVLGAAGQLARRRVSPVPTEAPAAQ